MPTFLVSVANVVVHEVEVTVDNLEQASELAVATVQANPGYDSVTLDSYDVIDIEELE